MQPNIPRRFRRVTLSALAALSVLVFVWQLWPAPSSNAGIRALLLCIPLLLPLRGLAHGRRYTYRWATLCVLPYLVVGMTEVIANPQQRYWAAAMLALALLLFGALIGFLRVSQRAEINSNAPTSAAQTAP